MRFALVIVIEGKDPCAVWEDVSTTLGDNNNLLFDSHNCVFVGDPYEIPEADEYDSLRVVQVIFRAELRNPLRRR